MSEDHIVDVNKKVEPDAAERHRAASEVGDDAYCREYGNVEPNNCIPGQITDKKLAAYAGRDVGFSSNPQDHDVQAFAAECVRLREENASLGDALENMTAEFTRRTILLEACQKQLDAADACISAVRDGGGTKEELLQLIEAFDATRKEASDA